MTALLRRERRPARVSFWFRADPGTREELARRKAACCPFLDYRVEPAGDELLWTTASVGEQRGAIHVFLDALHDLPGRPDQRSNRGEDALKPLNVR